MKRYSQRPGTRIFTLEFNRPRPELGVVAGSFMAINTAEQYPFRFLACHPIQAEVGDIFAALAEGAAEFINPDATAFELAEAMEGR